RKHMESSGAESTPEEVAGDPRGTSRNPGRRPSRLASRSCEGEKAPSERSSAAKPKAARWLTRRGTQITK
ncbi:hypothetical protein AAVH_20117, partial [Aphelenchoides avenae]